MQQRALRLSGIFGLLLALASCAASTSSPATPRSQVARGAAVSLSGEVVSFDPATRAIAIEGPLGGVVAAVVSKDVTDVSGLTPGAMVSVTYYEAIGAAVRLPGDAQPTLTAADAARRRQPGMPVEAAATTKTFRVFSVEPSLGAVVFEGADKALTVVEVDPAFHGKLADLKVGDQVDVTYSEAVVTAISPLTPGQEPQIGITAGTLVIDKGEVVRRVDNTVFIRNDRGRLLRVQVDPDTRFMLDGRQSTVFDLEPGTRLTRTALRVKEASYSAQ